MEEKRGSPTFTLSRRIGSTTFKVNAFCSDTAAETFEDKIMRIIKNEAGTNAQNCGIMHLPQMSRPA